MVSGVEVLSPVDPGLESVLSAGALEFLSKLHRQFNPRRLELLRAREERQAAIDAGAPLGFLDETNAIPVLERA